MIPSDQAPPDVDFLMRRLADLERQVRELQAGRRLEAATIGAGGIRIQGGTVVVVDADGAEIIRIGKVPGFSGEVPGLTATRAPSAGGSVALSLRDGIYAVWDRVGNVAMSTDEVSGQGLATPWIPLTARPSTDYTSPPVSTTSTSFASQWTVSGDKQHPRVKAVVLVQADAATAGEIRLRDPVSGVVIAAAQAIPAAEFASHTLVGSVAGDHTTRCQVDVEVRRTSGSGAIRTLVTYVMGVQS
ncbi:hypothetical protein ABZ777_32540 [Micromonospora parva]|uniref:hypothetical protein n=1 Tax=Micromonospora parva TaxID=1464048 RepID=UPI0033F65CBA